VSALVRLYPAAWRDRYGAEFETLLVERPPTARDRFDIVLAAVDARLAPQLIAEPVVGRTPISARLAGGAAIAGGLTWCVTVLVAGVLERNADISLPIVAALGLMLLSLPGSYVGTYARPIALACAAVGVSVALWVADGLPWGPSLLIPTLLVLGVLGPGALALAAARARISARDRWRLVLLTMPWPIAAIILGLIGAVPETPGLPVLMAAVLPVGIAWMVTGARIARGSRADASEPPPNLPTPTIATTGGAA
jgi:hypothetical protein